MHEFFISFQNLAGIEPLAQNQPFDWNSVRLPISRAPLHGEHYEPIVRNLLGLEHEQLVDLLVGEAVH
jgi:hypothetical protein